MELRPYQQEARQAVTEKWNNGDKRTLLVLPTGCGKTIVFAKISEDCVRHGDRVLILAHRGELLDQAAEKIKKIHRAWMRCGKGGRKLPRELVPDHCRICANLNEAVKARTVQPGLFQYHYH